MTDLISKLDVLEIPRGDTEKPPLRLDMSKLYIAESRISETRVSNPATASDLMAVFNEASNTGSKYVAWLRYEILRAKRNFDLAKATVMIDKLPTMVSDLKKAGIKDNSDFRAALVDRDPECRMFKDALDTLEATKSFIEAKVKSFERSYWDAKATGKALSEPGLPSLSVPGSSSTSVQGDLGGTQQVSSSLTTSFIGKTKF